MEEENDGHGDGNSDGDMEAEATAEPEGTGQNSDEPLTEVPWDGTLDGETIELKEDEQ